MPNRVARIRIELRRSKPRIWRRIDVPLSYTLLSLHYVIQVAFDWHGGHLYEFQIADREFTDLDLAEGDPFGWAPEDASKVRLEEVVKWGVKKFNYTYDFGDNWEHIVTVLRVLDAKAGTDYPALVAGANRSAIEDVGGIWGFYNLAAAAADPDHPEREELMEWAGEDLVENFDLTDFDADWVRSRLARLGKNTG